MTQTRAAITLTGRDLAYQVAAVMQDILWPPPEALTLFEAGSDNWRIEAYFPDPPVTAALHAAITAIIARALPPFEVAPVPDLNWVALSQAALPPVSCGRFRVHGAHDRARVPQGPGAILIEAGEAFGTAHHATTYGCLQAIDRLTRRQRFKQILDLGCGSGVLAIALARADPDARITASDSDPRSVEVARGNISANRARGRIRLVCARGLDHAELRWPRFDLVVANILAGPLVALARPLARAVRVGGTAILSGLLIHEAPAVANAYRAAGFVLKSHATNAGWAVLVLRRRTFSQPR